MLLVRIGIYVAVVGMPVEIEVDLPPIGPGGDENGKQRQDNGGLRQCARTLEACGDGRGA